MNQNGKINSKVHQYRSIRLHENDYSSAGAYFVTVCTKDRKNIFGKVLNGEMRPSPSGEIVKSCWDEIPAHFPKVELDAFVIMPDHMHGIIMITDSGKDVGHEEAMHILPNHREWGASFQRPKGPGHGSVGAIVGSFKSAVTRQINILRGISGETVWQRNYYEHIIRNEAELKQIRLYIEGNPLIGD